MRNEKFYNLSEAASLMHSKTHDTSDVCVYMQQGDVTGTREMAQVEGIKKGKGAVSTISQRSQHHLLVAPHLSSQLRRTLDTP